MIQSGKTIRSNKRVCGTSARVNKFGPFLSLESRSQPFRCADPSPVLGIMCRTLFQK